MPRVFMHNRRHPVMSDLMKKFIPAILLLLWICLPVCSQLLLNTGDTWNYQFSSLPKTGSISVFVTNPVASVTFHIDSSTFQSGDKLRYEMFENSAFETPICSNLMVSAPPFTLTCRADGGWQDVQGAIRLTMVSGSLSVTGVTLYLIRAGPSLSSYDVYSSTFIPQPEPPVALSSTVRDGKLIVSWPQGSATDFGLQAATNLPAMGWTDVTNVVYALGSNYYTTNEIAGPRRFFRLRSRP